MANSRASGVIYVDTNDSDFSGIYNIRGIKYIGQTSGTATITDGTGGSGAGVWDQNGATDAYDDVDIRLTNGFNVALTNSAVIYIYLR